MCINMVQRFTQHNSDYGKMKNVNIYMTQFTLIDRKCLSKAETDIKDLLIFGENTLLVDGRKELVTLT